MDTVQTKGDMRMSPRLYIFYKKMQLDVGVSPPANIMTFRPGLTYMTFDLDPRDL